MKNKKSEVEFVSYIRHRKYCSMETIPITKQDENKLILQYSVCPYCGKYVENKRYDAIDLSKDYY